MLDAAYAAGATVIHTAFHRFAGGGITGVVAVQESHLTIHTWPELRYAAVDVFLCGTASPERAVERVAERLRAGHCAVTTHARGHDAPVARAVAAPVGGHRTAMGVLYALTIVTAMCSLVYELLLAQTLSALLGNTVLRYSVTIGCYLGALGLGAILCGSRPANAAARLVRVEIALSAVGGLSVVLFYFFDMVHRWFYSLVPAGSLWEPVSAGGFLLATHGLIVAIGLLSGFEIPLLLTLGESLRPGSTNRVLGVDYFGALLGSVLFPLVLLRSLGLLATGFAVALLNAVAAAALIVWRPEGRRVGHVVAAAACGTVLFFGLLGSEGIEQYFLRKFYYFSDHGDLWSLLSPHSDRPAVARYRSPYQTIDLLHRDDEAQWAYDAVAGAPATDRPRDLWLFLDGEFQLFSGSETLYHEWFVHAPVQAVGRSPRTVLVLGGGDGAAVREIVKYPGVRRIVHVDIDPEMVRLAREDPGLRALNGGADDDPRVEVVIADAFSWLRTTAERFDAIWIDVPYARDYNLSMLYSREFYSLARARLAPDGFLALDAPSGWCDHDDNLWSVYYSTLRAAGFRTVLPLVSRTALDAPQVVGSVERLLGTTNVQVPIDGGEPITLTKDQARQFLTGRLGAILDGGVHEFIFAREDRTPLRTEWHDFGIPLRAFGPHHLPLALDPRCGGPPVAADVNSIFRPTLPPFELSAVRFP
jgi:spermidine synthase